MAEHRPTLGQLSENIHSKVGWSIFIDNTKKGEHPLIPHPYPVPPQKITPENASQKGHFVDALKHF